MNRSFYYVEIFILLLLYYVGWNLPPKSVFKCSRIKSKLVRLIIQKRVLPVLNRYKLSFPLSCPFHNERDVLWWPDLQLDFQEGQWICPFCGRIFSSEVIVTEHWDDQHLDHEAEESVCLANFCDIFRCEIILAALEVEKNKYAWDKFYKYQYPLSKAPCDERKMLLLQEKCKITMKNCLLDLLLETSTKDFQDVEDEVSHSICSYLTCNKYSDGSLQVVKPVPVYVVIVVASVLIGVFCFCFYLVYILSNPESFVNKELLCNGATPSSLYAQQYNDYINRRREIKNKYYYRRR